jgi:hypothetical protein
MKTKLGILIAVLFVVIAPFFVQVCPQPPSVSFNYFLDTLKFIEHSLQSAGIELDGYALGDFELEAVVADLELTDEYLANFEVNPEAAMLTNTPRYEFAFRDLSGNPIRIWIGTDSFRIYSVGDDGISRSGGRDPDDIWTGEPEKAKDYVHTTFFKAWTERNRRNLWTHLIDQLR